MRKKDPRHSEILQHSRKIKQRRLLNKWLWLGSTVLILLLIFVIVVNLPVFKIAAIEITGIKTLDSVAVNKLVEESLTGRRFLFLPRRNAWFYPESEIRKILVKGFSETESVSFSLTSFFQRPTLVMEINERRPAARWCRDSSSAECYLADKGGVIFSPSPIFSEHVYLTFSQPLAREPLGTRPVSLDRFNQLVTSRANLEKIFKNSPLKHFVIYRIETSGASDYSLVADNLFNPGEQFKIFINADKDLGVAVHNASVVISSPVFAEEVGKNNRRLDYFDLRFAPKVFYKLRPVI